MLITMDHIEELDYVLEHDGLYQYHLYEEIT